MQSEGTFGVRDGESAFVVDMTAFPVLFVTFFGAPTEPLVHKYYEWLHEMAVRSIAEDTYYTTIADARHGSRPPATVRTLFAKLSEAISEEHHARNGLSIVVHGNPLIRGALTAIQWMSRRALRMETADSMTTAIKRARAMLDTANIPVPENLGDDYPTPAFPSQDLSA